MISKEKQDYNYLVEEYHDYNDFLDDLTYSNEEKEKALPKVFKLYEEMSECLKWFKQNNVKFTDEEANQGFKT